jgi:hypothetical protein
MNNRFSFWMVIGIAIGAAMGVATHEIAKGVAWGAAIGVLLSLSIDSFKRNIRNTKNRF